MTKSIDEQAAQKLNARIKPSGVAAAAAAIADDALKNSLTHNCDAKWREAPVDDLLAERPKLEAKCKQKVEEKLNDLSFIDS